MPRASEALGIRVTSHKKIYVRGADERGDGNVVLSKQYLCLTRSSKPYTYFPERSARTFAVWVQLISPNRPERAMGASDLLA